MTATRVINRNAMPALIEALMGPYRLHAPTVRDGVSHFGEITAVEEVRLDLPNTDLSAKELFLPRCENLFFFREGELVEALPATDEPPRLLFGVRPCDAASLPMLDAVFGDSTAQDPYYVARRAHTLLVGMACNHPRSTCFCTSMGGGPFATQGLDILLCDLGERYLLEPLSNAGQELLDRVASAPKVGLQEATAAEQRAKETLAQKATAAIRLPLETAELAAHLAEMYDDPFWDELHQKCLGCGVCSYLCPTCHCFDVVDETNGRQGRRARIWDCCQYPLFTHHASGHNPRPTAKERMRQRLMHKFRYFVDNYEQIACVGCGRCVRHCPVNMDIRQVIGAIMAR